MKTLRIFLWLVKGALLIALAALVMWPVSRGLGKALDIHRADAGEDYFRFRLCRAGCWRGWLIVKMQRWHLLELSSADRVQVQDNFQAWRVATLDAPFVRDNGYWPPPKPTTWPSQWGPFRWELIDVNKPDTIYAKREFAAPLWLVALVFGVWPAVSLSLAVRRRARGRGLCEACGYDLRATPTPPEGGGPVLAVCPECGHSETRSTKPESRKE